MFLAANKADLAEKRKVGFEVVTFQYYCLLSLCCSYLSVVNIILVCTQIFERAPNPGFALYPECLGDCLTSYLKKNKNKNQNKRDDSFCMGTLHICDLIRKGYFNYSSQMPVAYADHQCSMELLKRKIFNPFNNGCRMVSSLLKKMAWFFLKHLLKLHRM